jgi:tetratricopeptide (TPR) repeat protein
MGTVFRAYDPELERAVAVKVLHEVDADACVRLRREAQAMARLTHPNVVTVYDVVADDDLVFVAMELVEGQTLRALARGAGWRDVLAACIAAGRGLAAAHAAKLVHRDFKPDNVLCGADGRVAVTDFGLARSLDDGEGEPRLVGTPAYMAPEVYRGEPATPSSDQFSFCATTYELLYGHRAFAADDLHGLRDAILEGHVREPPATTAVSAHVWHVLARGLARDPNARFHSMNELLDTLGADPAARRRRRIAFAAALVAALATGALIVRAVVHTVPSCEISTDELAGAWDPARRAVVDAAVRGAGGDTGRIDAALDAYAASWIEARRDACEATHVRGTDSERVLDARNVCLDRARRELDALTELLATADRALVDRAVEAVYRLRDPASCRVDLRPSPPLPERDKLDRAAALYAAGRDEDADVLAKQVVETLPPSFAPQLVAEALLVRGQVANVATQSEASQAHLFDALAAAERAHDDRGVAEVWISLLASTGATEHKFELATMAARAASAAMGRIEVDRSLAASYAHVLGTTLLAQGKLGPAREQLQRALVLADADRARPGRAAGIRSALCHLETNDRHHDVARAMCAAALAQLEAAFGPEHIMIASVLQNVGNVELDQRQWEAADHAYTRAMAIFERRDRRDNLGYAVVVANLGWAWAGRQDFARAVPLFESARELFAARYPKHPLRMSALGGLADAAYNRGDFATAIRYFQEAHTVVEANYGKDHPQLTDILYNLSNAYAEHHDLENADAVLDQVITRATEANRHAMVGRALEGKAALADQRDQVRAAIALRERALAAFDRGDHPYARAWTQQMLGDSYVKAGKPDRAIEPLERAVAYFTRASGDRYEKGAARFSLARVLWASGRDRVRAVALAREAKSDLAAVEVRDAASLLREVDAWLASHTN